MASKSGVRKANEYNRFIAKEWDAGGVYQFYGSRKPRSYILEVQTTDLIDGDVLQAAVDRALKRMPYYASTFVRKRGLYYYADNRLPLLAARSEKARSIGGRETNYHMLDVNYFENVVRFAWFHGLCDGLGINRFAEAVLYHYFCIKDFCIKDGKDYDDEGIYTDKLPYDDAEIYDAYSEEASVDARELKKLQRKEKRFRLPELDTGKGPEMFRFSLKIKTEDFLGFCEGAKASPGAVSAAIMTQSVARNNSVSEGVIMSVLPTSLRRFTHAEKTFKNCTAAVFLPAGPDAFNSMGTGELAAKLREEMNKQLTEENTRLLIDSINLVTHLGRKVPTYFLKNKILSIKEKNPQDTFSVDYVGGLRTNGYSEKITDVRYLNADAYRGSMTVFMSDTAGHFYISVNQTFASPVYFEGFLQILEENGIPYEKLAAGMYLNPEVVLPKESK